MCTSNLIQAETLPHSHSHSQTTKQTTKQTCWNCSNRAAAYTKLATWDLALEDCEECIKREPEFIKGYLRKGNILLGIKKISEAEKAFQQVW